MEKWDACGTPLDDLEGKECFGGLDLSSTTDISAFVLVFPVDDGYDVLPFFWVPEEGARVRERKDRVPYGQWIRAGLIEATAGEVVDYDVVRKRIQALGERFRIKEVAIDRWNATQLATQLEGDGFEMIAFGQGYASMSAPTKRLEELILSQKVSHANHPVLRWMAGNVAIEKDSTDNWKPSKKRSRERIDGIVALIMALDRATTTPPEEPCWYVPGTLAM